MLKRLFLLGAALLALAACDGGPRVVQTASGKLVYDCATTPATSTDGRTAITPRGRPGPCYDGTDITDRRNYDTIRNITPIRNDDTRDITPRRNYDDTRDRTIYCIDVGAVITAPSFIVFFEFDKSDLTANALDTIGQAAQAYKSKGGARVTGDRPYRHARARRATTWRCRCAAPTRSRTSWCTTACGPRTSR